MTSLTLARFLRSAGYDGRWYLSARYFKIAEPSVRRRSPSTSRGTCPVRIERHITFVVMAPGHKIDRLFLDLDAIFGTEKPNRPAYGRDRVHIELHCQSPFVEAKAVV